MLKTLLFALMAIVLVSVAIPHSAQAHWFWNGYQWVWVPDYGWWRDRGWYNHGWYGYGHWGRDWGYYHGRWGGHWR